MFGDYSLGDLGAIFAMQGFAGLILFSVYVLMALGLAIIFGQMGVINMAHGEFMILGAYVTWMTSNAFQQYAPSLFPGYFFVAMTLAFIASGALGMLVEWALIRHLYKRPLDTLLATWGLSLILQQAYRSVFGAREVGVELPDWMMGSWQATDSIQIPINGMFVMALTILITLAVAYVLFWSSWGKQVRAVVQNRVMAGVSRFGLEPSVEIDLEGVFGELGSGDLVGGEPLDAGPGVVEEAEIAADHPALGVGAAQVEILVVEGIKNGIGIDVFVIEEGAPLPALEDLGITDIHAH